MDTPSGLPPYSELPVADGAPPGSSWGLWGEHDVLGALNLQTPERALRAAASIRTGRWYSLDLDLGMPDPPLFGRPRLRHEVTGEIGGGHDDLLHNWNTQSSTQWDGFRHFAHRHHGHYGGLPDEEHGIDYWAARGLVGRCVLVDVDRWRTAQGRPLHQGTGDPIPVADLRACIEDQGTAVVTGDVVLVRTGWLTWYRSLDGDARARYAAGDASSPGPAGDDLPEFIWDLHVSALAADNPGVEMMPPAAGYGFLHPAALPLLGIPLGELFDLDGLAADCADARTYDAFFTSAPISVRGGVGSPPNAIAIR
jgi:hypothetical protein